MPKPVAHVARKPVAHPFVRRWVGVVALAMTVAVLPALGARKAEEPDDVVKGAMYRYVNADGVQVVDFSIPPQYVDKGYDVLSPAGRLIRHVPARAEGSQLTAEQIKARQEQEKMDAYILRSYSSLEDVARARTRRLQLVEREISILKSNIMDYARREAELKERAASYQASGQAPPESVTQVLPELEAQKNHARQQLVERQAQYREVMDRYDLHARRLKELRPELVRRPVASEKSPQK